MIILILYVCVCVCANSKMLGKYGKWPTFLRNVVGSNNDNSRRQWRRERKYAPKIMTLNHKWMNLFDCYRTAIAQYGRESDLMSFSWFTFTAERFSLLQAEIVSPTTHHHTHTHTRSYSPLDFNHWISFYFYCNFYTWAHISHFHFEFRLFSLSPFHIFLTSI